MTWKKLKRRESEQSRINIDEGTRFVHLVMFIIFFSTELYCLRGNFISSDSKYKYSCYLLLIVIAMS